MPGELSVKQLCVRRGDFSLRMDQLVVQRGTITCVMGKSGSGKTTLLNAIGGFLPLVSGEISLGERSLDGLPPEKRRIAMVFQRPALFPHWRVIENVEFSLRLQKVKPDERRARALQWLEKLGIAELADRYPEQVSEGQGQRVALARALISGFPALLLDEPFSALDVATRSELRKVVKSLVRESQVTALMVTHDEEDARELGDSVVRL